jgi:hypothetical protein
MIIPDPDAPATKEFLADLWRLCLKHGLAIDESGTVFELGGHDVAAGGYDLSEHGELLLGKRGP